MPELIKVHDGYGRWYYVYDYRLERARRLNKLVAIFDGDGDPMFDTKDGHRLMLHPGNICEHPISTFHQIRVLGDQWLECPICVTARLAQALSSGSPQSPGAAEPPGWIHPPSW